MAATQAERARLLEPLDTGVNGGGTVDLSPTPRTSISDQQHELPILAPLSHSHPQLTSTEPFDVDSFLLSRSNLSLQDLRSELRGYLAELKEELVQLINDDYAAFISLSTDLKGEGVRLDRIHQPLGGLKDEIEVCVSNGSTKARCLTRPFPEIARRASRRPSRSTGETSRKGDIERRKGRIGGLHILRGL